MDRGRGDAAADKHRAVTTIHLPSGRVVTVGASVAAATRNLADYCPQRAEHTVPMNRRRYVAMVHGPCGLAVVWVRKAGRG